MVHFKFRKNYNPFVLPSRIGNTGFQLFHYWTGESLYSVEIANWELLSSRKKKICSEHWAPFKHIFLLFFSSFPCMCVLGLVCFFRWNRESLCLWRFQPCWHFAGQYWKQPWLHVDYLGLETRKDCVKVKSFFTGCLQGHIFSW